MERARLTKSRAQRGEGLRVGMVYLRGVDGVESSARIQQSTNNQNGSISKQSGAMSGARRRHHVSQVGDGLAVARVEYLSVAQGAAVEIAETSGGQNRIIREQC